MENDSKYLIFSSFIMKVMGLIFMTIDHVGVFLQLGPLKADDPIVVVCRLIGQLALPIFCFLIAEGVKNTKNKGFYALRLGTIAVIVSATLLLINKNLFSTQYIGNIFIDLLLGAVACMCLANKDNRIKFLVVLPIAFSIISLIVKNYEAANTAVVYWFPYFIRTQYDIYSVGMIVFFYCSYYFAKLYLDSYSERSGISRDLINGSSLERFTTNLIGFFGMLCLSLIIVVLNKTLSFKYVNAQGIAIVSGIFILLYNGKRGYNAPWFKYGCYIYYPAHIAILFLIFTLLGY